MGQTKKQMSLGLLLFSLCSLGPVLSNVTIRNRPTFAW